MDHTEFYHTDFDYGTSYHILLQLNGTTKPRAIYSDYKHILFRNVKAKKGAMYLLTKSETLNTGVTVSFTSGTDTGNIIDGDRTTNS